MPDRIFSCFPILIRFPASIIEGLLWALINKIPLRRLRFRGMKILSDDALLSFVYRDFRGSFSLRSSVMAQFPIVLAHLSHYCIDLSAISANAASLKDRLWFIAEAPLHKTSAIFREGFAWYDREVFVLPFVPQLRFQAVKPIFQRQHRAVSTGSFHLLDEEPDVADWLSFRNLSGLNTVHPLRMHLSELRSEVQDEIHVMNSRFWEKKSNRRNDARSMKKTILDSFSTIINKITGQKSYFAYNMVDLYNEFQFSVVGEEATGLPGIGMSESMACGCVYLGDHNFGYELMGMVEGEHFIGYDGTIQGLRLKILELRSDPQRLELISEAARSLANSKWNAVSASSNISRIVENLLNRTVK